jgi:hypothetical protein
MSKFQRFSVTMVLLFLMTFGLGATAASFQHFDRAVFVVFENTNYAAAMKQPFFSQLAANGAQFTNFLAQTHPSQGNYVALTSGSLNGVRDDRNVDINSTNIVDLLEAKGLSWKAYIQAYPGNCFSGKSSANYVRKHNPFISYTNIRTNPSRCAKIVDATEFDRDVQNGTLPNYAFYVPDMKNDGHNTGVAFANDWYDQKFSPLFNDPSFMKDTIIISTFDESGPSFKNQIYTSIVGGPVKIGSYSNAVTHYSLLQMIEDNWSLGNLGREDATATPMPAIWR